MNQLTKVFEEQKLTIIEVEGDFHFLLKDVCEILEIVNVSALKARLNEKNVKLFPVVDSMGRTQNANFVNDEGLLEVIYSSRKPQALELAENLGFKVLKATKEQEFLEIIMKSFSHYKSITQYNVNGYLVDLYFPDFKLAIECDEYGHERYTRKNEDKERQKAIERKTGCKFIRFNPDSKGFNIGDVINEIMKGVYIYESTSESV